MKSIDSHLALPKALSRHPEPLVLANQSDACEGARMSSWLLITGWTLIILRIWACSSAATGFLFLIVRQVSEQHNGTMVGFFYRFVGHKHHTVPYGVPAAHNISAHAREGESHLASTK